MSELSTPPVPCFEHTASRVRPGSRLVDYMKDRLALVPVTEVGDLITGGRTWIRAARELPPSRTEAPRAARGVSASRDGGSDSRDSSPGAGASCAGWIRGRTTDLVADGDGIAIESDALALLEASGRWTPPWAAPLSILHEDADLLVVDKPARMHVHPLGDRREHTLVNALVHHAGGGCDGPWASWRPHAVQRLDFVVSGVLAVAKNAEAKAVLVRAQTVRGIERTYTAMVYGRIRDDGGVVDAPVGREPGRGYRRAIVPENDGGLRAVTRWRVLERFDDRTRIEVTPETGRTHQIRVHLAHLGHPIVGDVLYSDAGWVASRIGEPAAPSAAIALHATRLRLAHPVTGETLVFDSPPP